MFDYCVRGRLGGLNLSFFVLDEVAVVKPVMVSVQALGLLAARLNCGHPLFAVEWLRIRTAIRTFGNTTHSWHGLWAITSSERLRMRSMIDAITAELYGLS